MTGFSSAASQAAALWEVRRLDHHILICSHSQQLRGQAAERSKCFASTCVRIFNLGISWFPPLHPISMSTQSHSKSSCELLTLLCSFNLFYPRKSILDPQLCLRLTKVLQSTSRAILTIKTSAKQDQHPWKPVFSSLEQCAWTFAAAVEYQAQPSFVDAGCLSRGAVCLRMHFEVCSFGRRCLGGRFRGRRLLWIRDHQGSRIRAPREFAAGHAMADHLDWARVSNSEE